MAPGCSFSVRRNISGFGAERRHDRRHLPAIAGVIGGARPHLLANTNLLVNGTQSFHQHPPLIKTSSRALKATPHQKKPPKHRDRLQILAARLMLCPPQQLQGNRVNLRTWHKRRETFRVQRRGRTVLAGLLPATRPGPTNRGRDLAGPAEERQRWRTAPSAALETCFPSRKWKEAYKYVFVDSPDRRVQ